MERMFVIVNDAEKVLMKPENSVIQSSVIAHPCKGEIADV